MAGAVVAASAGPAPAAEPPTASEPPAARSGHEQEPARILQVRGDAQRGEVLFVLCEGCHGGDGRGELDGAVPAIAGQYERVIVQELLDFRHGRRRDPAMERIVASHELTHPRQLADVAAYVSRLPHAPALQTGDGTLVSHGADVYPRLCATCHGEHAQGDARRGIPWMASQQYGYLRLEMYYVIDHRRPNMAVDHSKLFRHFDRSEFEGLPDYLSRLPP